MFALKMNPDYFDLEGLYEMIEEVYYEKLKG